MAKKLFCICMGFLLLAVSASAVPVDPNGTTIFYSGLRVFVLCQDGKVTQIDWNGDVFPQPPVPMPLTDIAEYFGFFLITNDGSLWRMNTSEWVIFEDLPCPLPVSSQNESLGDVKSLYR